MRVNELFGKHSQQSLGAIVLPLSRDGYLAVSIIDIHGI